MLSWPAPHVPLLPGNAPALRLFDDSVGGVRMAGGPERAGLLVCGRLPVGGPHLGDVAIAVAADLVVRAWRDAHLVVGHVQVVDDTTPAVLARAAEAGLDAGAVVHEEATRLARVLTTLGVLPPDRLVGVSESAKAAVGAVEYLLAQGAAYRVPLPDSPTGAKRADIYADLTLDPVHGAGPRLAPDPVLWRSERPGESGVDGGPFGAGRPGVPLACAVSALEHSGEAWDVFAGGRDLAVDLAMCASHVRMLTGEERPVQRRVLTGFVRSGGRPMSRSGGNVVLVEDLLERGVAPLAVRLHVLAHHYRTGWDHTEAGLEAAQQRLERWTAAVSGNGGPDPSAMIAEVRAALSADLDTPRALRAVDAWADLALSYGRPGGVSDADMVEGGPGLVARAVDALLGVRL